MVDLALQSLVEWETGLGWFLAALIAAFAAPLADTQHARSFGAPPFGRFTDVALNDLPVLHTGWPPGLRTTDLTSTGPPAALLTLSA